MKLKEYLDKSGIKQNFLANKAGISPVTFSLYVLGKKVPNIETAWKIHKATNGAVTFQDWLHKETDIDSNANITNNAKTNKNSQITKKTV